MNMNLDALRAGKPAFLARLPKVPVASAISGLIVAALILMTPNTLFEAFIVQTGLPGMIDAAAPPLGAKARIVFALIAAVIVTIGAWVALSILLRDRGGDTAYGYGHDEENGLPPRRRADSHPDHPARAPLMAHDLGAPLDLVTVAPDEPSDDFADFGPADAPAFGEPEQPFEPAPAAFDPPAEQSPRFAPEAPSWEEPFAPQPEPAQSTQSFEPPAFETPAFDPPAHNPQQAETPAGPEPEPAPEPVAQEQEPEPVFTVPLKPRPAAGEPAPEASGPQPAPPQRDVQSELGELIDRLEAGLAHRRERLNKQAQPEAAAPEAATTDGALREALDALQRLTAKGA
ncbi:MAG: hypothetical protein RLN87_00740 [Parasphingopyxis sp.]|uniref:hypothetical protein n=1 Tax=Parasphingopyxis sp. TaxID=1920299 RepID=UPI0032EE9A9A